MTDATVTATIISATSNQPSVAVSSASVSIHVAVVTAVATVPDAIAETDALVTPATVATFAAQAPVSLHASSSKIVAPVVAAISAVGVPPFSQVVLPDTVAAIVAQDPVGVTIDVTVAPDVVYATTMMDNPRVVSPYDRWRPRVKPGGSVVLLCCTQVGNHDTTAGFEEMTLWAFRLNGEDRVEVKGTPGSITDDAATPSSLGWLSYGHPEWAPSGSEVVIWVETSSAYHLVTLDGEDFSLVATLHSVSKPDRCGDPAYSPDGTQIVFTEKLGSTYYLSTLTLAATPVYTHLASSSDPLYDPTFSADGTQILYAKKTGSVGIYGEWDLKLIPAAGGTATTILSDSDAHMHPAWIDNSTIIFQNHQYGRHSAFRVATIRTDGTGFTLFGSGEYPQVVNV